MDTITKAVPKPEEIRAELRRMLAEVRLARSLLKVAERVHGQSAGRATAK